MSNPKISQDGTHVNGSASPPDFERFVTDDHPSPSYAGKQSAASTSAAGQQQQQSGGLITVQPLAKASLQPSYAQDLGTGSVRTSSSPSLLMSATRRAHLPLPSFPPAPHPLASDHAF